jgi:hypothetical protein
LLASLGARGLTESALLAHDFTIDMLADLVRDGLASAQSETVRAGGRMIEVA